MEIRLLGQNRVGFVRVSLNSESKLLCTHGDDEQDFHNYRYSLHLLMDAIYFCHVATDICPLLRKELHAGQKEPTHEGGARGGWPFAS